MNLYSMSLSSSMIFSLAVIMLLLFHTSNASSTNTNHLYNTPPQIEPYSDDVTIDMNSNYKMRCEADKPIKWFYYDSDSFPVNEKIQFYSTQNPIRPFGAELTLINMTVYNVRYYFCIHDDIQIDEKAYGAEMEEYEREGLASKIYVFVNDLDNLLVPIYFPLISAVEGKNATIPCKPTHPGIEVQLESSNHEESYFSGTQTSKIKFDAKNGFIMITEGQIDTGHYTCTPKNPSITNEGEIIVFQLTVSPKREFEDGNITDPLVERFYKFTNSGGSGDLIVEKSTKNFNNNNEYFGDGELNNNNYKNFEFANNLKIENLVKMLTTTTTTTIDQSSDARITEITTIAQKNFLSPLKHTNSIKSTLLDTWETITTTETNSFKIFSSSVGSAPNIRDFRIVEQPFNGHVIDGTSFNLTCQITRDLSTLFSTTWSHPNMAQIKKEKRWFESGDIIDESGTIVKKKLTIVNAKKMTDSGKYKCTVDDSQIKRNQYATIKVLDENEHYIDLYEEKNIEKLIVNASKRINMVVKYIGHPHPTIVWKKPDKSLITPNDNLFEIQTEDSKSILSIKSPQLRNSGYYTVVAANEFLEKEYKFLLQVKDKPILHMHDIYYEMVGREMQIICQCDAFPEPKITWTFIPCKIRPKWPKCDTRSAIHFNDQKNVKIHKSDWNYKAELRFTPTQPGLIQCRAENKINETVREAEVRIGDIEGPISIDSSHSGLRIATGDTVTLTCSALAYNYSDNLNWYRNDIPLEKDQNIEISAVTTEFSYQKRLIFKDIQHSDSGSYECRVQSVTDDDETTENKFINIEVHSPQPPHIYEDNSYEEIIYKEMGRQAEMQCKADGLPKPTVTWLKDDVPISLNNDNIDFVDDNHTIIIKVVRPNDSEGVYKCVLENRLGTVERRFELQISDYEPGFSSYWIAVISGFIIILLLLIIFLCIRVYKDQQIRKQLKAIGIENFEKGAVEQINPALSIDEQADLLPYDKRFEFPRDKLHLGKQLGAGAFGIVHKAQAVDILPDEKETTVAVKMVKKTADNEVVRALVSELKIMVHLGQHLNVVNLLGAITKNIAKREVMVIVEYCRYGNVQNFLLKNRKSFINQINPQTDLIDPTITSNGNRFSNDFDNSSQGLRYVNCTFSNSSTSSYKNSHMKSDGDPRPGTRAGRPNSGGYIRQSDLYYGGSQVDSAMTQQTLIHSVPEGEEVLSNNSTQPVWRSNYKADSTTDTMEITTSHLVSWAFQVARGMDYLASRKVLHGDLAARNILLCEDNIVKICDFGLARSMYKNDNYKKDKDARLPIKWLALESLSDRVFSTRSDVWSFGIVLWEFFSLSKVPYPGMEAESLYERLKDGYRMERPPYANKELYEIMLECWRTNPDSRPLFDELIRRFAKLLEEEVTNHYIDLNEHYLRVNAEYEKTGQVDYLSMMGSPDDMAPAPPRYVNGNLIPEIKIENPNDYLQMNPKTNSAIFSPRPSSDDYVQADHFNFPQPASPTTSNNMDSPIVKNRSKNAAIPEEIPMLARQSLSDSDAENNVENGFQRNMPQQKSITQKQKNELGGDDNYINTNKVKPQDSRKQIGSNDAFTNPSYLILQQVNEKKK